MTLNYTITAKCKKLWQNKNTVVIKVMGGLGNQLSQYAFAKALQKMHNKNVNLDAHSFYGGNDRYNRAYLLSKFKIQIEEATKEINDSILSKKTINIKKHNYSKLRRFFKISFINHNENQFNIVNCLNEFKPLGFIYASGYWHSADIVNLCRKELLDDIQLVHKPSSEFYALINNIKSYKNSTAVHFRQSWNIELPKNQKYLGEKKINTIHTQNPLPIEYYEQAISIIKKGKKNTKFFIFADDIKKAKDIIYRILPTSEYYIIPHRHKNIYDYEDLLLMSSCSNFIMSNSSFSWWGTWLSWARIQDTQNNNIYIMPHDWNADGSGGKISEELTFSPNIIHV